MFEQRRKEGKTKGGRWNIPKRIVKNDKKKGKYETARKRREKYGPALITVRKV